MSKNYWVERTAKAQEAITNKHIEDIEKQLTKYYSKAMKRTIADFEATYDKLQATVADGVEPTPADLYKLDRYWELQAQLKTELEKLGDRQVKLFSDAFEEQFFDIYNSISIPSATAYSTIDKGIAQQMINQIWVADGKNFSQRIWGNTEKLIETLNEELINCVATGRNTNELKQLLQERFNVSYSNADSIVKTETAHIQTQAARKRYEDYGIQEVEVWADEDERRCEVCGKLHQKRYPVGANMPIPAHPRCRCAIIPVVEDNLTSTNNDDIIQKKMLKYIGKEPTSGDSLEVRKWYYANVHNLQNQIDRTKPIEEQARQGFELRNAYKTKARACMSDKEAANDLELSRPIKSFEELVQDKMKRKNLTREEAIKDVLKTISKTNKEVDALFGLGGN